MQTAYLGRRGIRLMRMYDINQISGLPILPSFLAMQTNVSRGCAPSGTGFQVSLYGVLGVLAASEEGFEINLLGLSFGFDLNRPALKLPFIGRLGLSNGNHASS